LQKITAFQISIDWYSFGTVGVETMDCMETVDYI